jgi:hypothetical protein
MHSTLGDYPTKINKQIPFEGKNAKAIHGETYPKLNIYYRKRISICKCSALIR